MGDRKKKQYHNFLKFQNLKLDTSVAAANDNVGQAWMSLSRS